METIEKLAARRRDETGSRAARRLRRAGEVPANLLGPGEEPVSLAVPLREFEILLRSGAHLVNLDLGSEAVEAIIREVQYDAFGDHFLHVDFDRLVRGQTLELEVELAFFGEPVGAAAGGFFRTHLNTLKVECLPRSIPDSIEVDVSDLEIGDEVRAADIKLPEGVSLAPGFEPDELVAVVSAPEGEEPEEELEEGEEAAEPQVLTGKKDDEKEDED